MTKKSPKRQPQPTDHAPAPEMTKPKAPPLKVKYQPLPPEAARRRNKFYEDSHEIEGNIWRSING